MLHVGVQLYDFPTPFSQVAHLALQPSHQVLFRLFWRGYLPHGVAGAHLYQKQSRSGDMEKYRAACT